MANLFRQAIPVQQMNFATGTWTLTAATSNAPQYYGKTATDETSTITIPFALPGYPDLLGAKLQKVVVPMLIGTADLDAVISGTLTQYNIWKAAIRPAQTFTANADSNVLTFGTVALPVGTAVTLTTSGSLPGGLATSTTYYVGGVAGSTTISGLRFQLYTTQANAFAGVNPIDITSAGSGTQTMTTAAIDAVNMPITETGTQVTFSSVPRRYEAAVTTTAYENTNAYNLVDVESYSLILSVNAGATSVVRVYDAFAIFERPF